MTIIAAITRNNALGKDGDMIYHISADLKRFKALTMGHPLVMGRRTFESFPNGPLPSRRNIVITRNPQYHHEGIEVASSLDSALDLCTDSEPMILGGGQIYAQAMSKANRLLITEIDVDANDADTFFPPIDLQEWHITDESQWMQDERSGVKFRYITYEKKT